MEVAAESAGLSAWNAAGDALLRRTGDYSSAVVYASPTDILVAGGAAGSNLVEDINVTSTNARNGTPYSGTARGWFSDGGYFYTSVGAGSPA